MKIIITESQMKRLQENMISTNDPIGKLHNFTHKSEQTLTKLFNELTNISVSEIINLEFKNIIDIITEIDDKSSVMYSQANDLVDIVSDKGNWDEYDRITDKLNPIWESFSIKLKIVEDLVNKLVEFKNHFSELDIMSKFEPLDITNIQ